GSLIGLLAYPVLIEPNLRLASQAWLWAIGYAGLAVSIAWCAVKLRGSPPPVVGQPAAAGDTVPSKKEAAAKPHDWKPAPQQEFRPGNPLLWMALAFVPSSLLLSVTTYATRDIAPIPLLWVVPLAIYLITFIIAFGN